jgi:hypothetical protein
MNIQNVLNALKNISLVFSLTPEEYDVYYCVLDIYNNVWEKKVERKYKDVEIEFYYCVHFNLGDLIDILNELGDFIGTPDEEFPTSRVVITIKKKEV